MYALVYNTLLQDVHTDSNPPVQVKVMYLKDVSVTSPTGFGRSILTTNLPKLSEPDIQNLCFSFGE